MGSLSAMASLDRVIEKHGPELQKELLEQAPEKTKALIRNVELSNEVYRIRTAWTFQNGDMLPGPELDIDMLAERFPDCEVGY